MTLLAVSQQQYADYQKGFESKYEDALERHSECLATKDIAKRQWDELQGRVELQSTLASRYRTLLSKHEETQGRLTEAEASRDAANNLVSSLENQIKKLQGNLNDLYQELDEEKANAESRELELQQNIRTCEHVLGISAEEAEDTSRQLADVRDSQEASTIQILSLQSTIGDLESSLKAANHKLEETFTFVKIQEKDFQNKLTIYENLLHIRTRDNEGITKKYEECNVLLPSCQDELVLLKKYIRKLQFQQCKME
jgi:chromosome segregation ATPase